MKPPHERHVARLPDPRVVAGLVAALGLPGCGSSAPPEALPVDLSEVSAVDPGSQLRPDWTRGALMEIYVRGYQDSDGDGIGDLRGLIQRLDYLADLGVRGLWLMPITASQDRDHGYAVADYRAIEPDYGSLADFDELVSQAHARGIGIILDYVMNHSAAQHPAFRNARQGLPPFGDWYVFAPSKPGNWRIYGSDPWYRNYGELGGYYFAGFWDQMPDFNLKNPDVVRWHQDNLRFWLNRGVDGFRFDAVGNLVENGSGAWENQPENYALMGEIHKVISSYANRYLVCEAPADPAGYAAAEVCGAAFAFGHQGDFVAAARGNADGVAAIAELMRAGAPGLASFVSNHDSFAGPRLFEQVNGEVPRYKLAAASYLLQAGTPFIYYGEEVGMAGAAELTGDPRLRTPMSWTGNRGTGGFTSGRPFRFPAANVVDYNVESEAADSTSLLTFYKAMLHLRASVPGLAGGHNDQVTAAGTVLTFWRSQGADHVLVVINYGPSLASPVVGVLPTGTVLRAAYPPGQGDVIVGAGPTSISVPPQQLAVFSYRQ